MSALARQPASDGLAIAELLKRPELLQGIIERAGRADWPRFEAQLKSSGYCEKPVRLTGYVQTCDGRRVWSTAGEPDGILRKACGNRREAVCRSCSQRYWQDAYHLLGAGLAGGKGVPDAVLEHPAVFATLTPPSFGPVHTRRQGAGGKALRCRPRRDAPICPHGVRMSCGQIHDEGDACLGEPICPECFDYAGAVLWNNHAGELWRRTTIYLPRTMARLLGITQRQLREQVRIQYAKTSEYHQRGLVHFHVVLRLDQAMPAYRAHEIKPPAPRYTAELLEEAFRATVREVSAPLPDEAGSGRVQWGSELDVRVIGQGAERSKAAAYLAKYTTKSAEQAGGLLRRVLETDIDDLPVSDHVRRYLVSAFDLHHQAGPELRLDACAHTFGYRGHCLTKSRRYSTTFKALREAREQYVHEQLLKRRGVPQSQHQLATLAKTDRITRFRYAGQGHLTSADAYLAESAGARARQERLAAREERDHALTTGTQRPIRSGGRHDVART